MKKRVDLPDYQPRKELWGKLLDSKELEQQIARELPNLPEAIPRKDVWPEISAALDSEKPKGLIWWRSAAVLLICSVAYLMFTLSRDRASVIEREYLLTDTYSDLDIPWVVHPPAQHESEDPALSHGEKVAPPALPMEKIDEQIQLGAIDVPELVMPELDPVPETMALAKEDQAQHEPPNESFHEVKISWDINDRIKIKTDFPGKKMTEDHHQQLAKVRAHSGKWVLRLSKEE